MMKGRSLQATVFVILSCFLSPTTRIIGNVSVKLRHYRIIQRFSRA
jgi:hypothetical protein